MVCQPVPNVTASCTLPQIFVPTLIKFQFFVPVLVYFSNFHLFTVVGDDTPRGPWPAQFLRLFMCNVDAVCLVKSRTRKLRLDAYASVVPDYEICLMIWAEACFVANEILA